MHRYLTVFFFLQVYSIVAQCTTTKSAGPFNPVCEDQFVNGSNLNPGITKIKLGDMLSHNLHTFTTVGESFGDTYLALYDSSNNLIAKNDDDPNCGGCKQSTLILGDPNAPSTTLSGYYLILSKPACGSIDFDTNIKFNARNYYDSDPKISSPVATIQCVGSTVQFEYKLPTNVSPDNTTNPWQSLDTNTAVIDNSGKAVFLNPGIAKIKLKVKSSCPVINNYIIIGSSTSSINY